MSDTVSVKPVTIQGQFVQVNYDRAKQLSGFQLYSEINKVCTPKGQATDTVEFIRGKTEDARKLDWWDKVKETLRVFAKTKIRKFVDFVINKFRELKQAIKDAVGLDTQEIRNELDLQSTLQQATNDQKAVVKGLVEEALKGLTHSDDNDGDLSKVEVPAQAPPEGGKQGK